MKIKIIDVDKLFSDYITDYVYANVGKVNPEEIENQMPILYEEFGYKPLKELDGKSPEKYYIQFPTDELIDCLKQHIEQDVDVSDFLCEAIMDADDSLDQLYKSLNGEEDEKFIMYILNMLAEEDLTSVAKGLLSYIVWDYSEPIRELVTEILYSYADTVKEEIVSQYNEVDDLRKACFTDILSHASKDDRVFNILIEEFIKNQDNIPLYAGYLGKYGDERALPFLMSTIENEKINYNDFEELRFAIECLGGEYTKERDFSKDKTYKKITSQTEEN